MASTDFDWINCTTPMPKINTTDGTSNNFTEAVRRSLESVTIDGTLANATTYKRYVAVPRTATIKSVVVAAGVKIVGGTNTLAVNKVTAAGVTTTSALSTATVDPTAVPAAAKAGTALTLNTTAANLALAQYDVIEVILTTGTQGTPGQDYSVVIELEFNDTAA